MNTRVQRVAEENLRKCQRNFEDRGKHRTKQCDKSKEDYGDHENLSKVEKGKIE